jgi:hypothetical protein
MRELACNIVAYRPDPAELAANFRPWHVEALLDQAATLIDRCRVDFTEYCSLDYAWNLFRTDLDTEERRLDSDKKKEAELAFGAAEDRTGSFEDLNANLEDSKKEPQEAVSEPASARAPQGSSRLELREQAVQQKKDLSAPGGPFALDGRRDLALQRLCRDYHEALNRAFVADRGLRDFYGHVEQASPVPPETEALAVSITTLTNWIRNSLEWLVSYRLREDGFTRVISVRSLLSRSAWVQLKQARDSFSTKLQIPASMFRDYDNCRLRGVSASLVGEAGTVPWSIVLRLPEEAMYARSGQEVEADQSSRSPCLLGRVENRRSPRAPETCGATSWIEASPIGRSNTAGLWSLDIFKPAGVSSETFSQVEDVVLEINVVGTI